MFSIQDIERLSSNELKALISECKTELEKRSDVRRKELIQAVCDAMNTLYREFPGIELNIPYSCPECGIEDEVDKVLLKSAIEKLTNREKNIMELRFGFISGTEKTQKEVADILGISQSYISRLEKKILEKIKNIIEIKVA